jgi:hypothetical protein
MNRKRLAALLVLLGLAGAMLAACGGGGGEEPVTQPAAGIDGQIANSVQQTVAAIAVAQTVAALTGAATPTAAPGQTDLPPAPTPLITSTAAPADATVSPPTATISQPPPEAAVSCTTISGVNLRSGPGLVYEPPVGAIGANASLRPIAYVPSGFPQGAWLLVEIVAVGQTAWVSAGPQFVRCTVDPATLPPPAVIPPTPRPPATSPPTPTATPQQVANLPPDLRNVSGGAGCLDDPDINSDFQTDSRFLLRIYAQLFNPPPDESGDGAGIDRVEFSVRESGYTHTERTAGYCIFQGGEPNCRDWPRNGLGQLTWGPGGPVVVDGDYNIDVAVVPKEETFISQCNWTISLTIDVP